VFHWDDDLLFMEKDLQKIKYAMRHSKEDSLDFQCRHFIYNFKFNILGRGTANCYRITDGLYLKRVSRAYYKDRRPYSIAYPDDITLFHYSYVKRTERMKARFVLSAEKGTPGAMEKFETWKSIAWDKEEDILENGVLRKIIPRGELNIYRGPHPEALDDHPWRHIDNARKVK